MTRLFCVCLLCLALLRHSVKGEKGDQMTLSRALRVWGAMKVSMLALPARQGMASRGY